MRVLATIHCRAGSRRYKRKNMAQFQGQPIMCWTIRKAMESSLVTDIVFSTDSQEMKNAAREMSENIVVVHQPDEFAKELEGLTIRNHGVYHTIKQWREVSGHHDPIVVLILQPLIISDTAVDRCADMMMNVIPYNTAHVEIPMSQWYEPLWIISGLQAFLSPQVPGPCRPVKLEPWEVVDLHTPQDHYIADAMVRFMDEQVMVGPAVESGR